MQHLNARNDRAFIFYENMTKNADSGERHPGHVDQVTVNKLNESLRKGKQPPLEIDATILTIDTTDFSNIDYPSLYNTVNLLLSKLEK